MKTKMMQKRIQTARAVNPDVADGVVDRTELNMLTNTFRMNITVKKNLVFIHR